MAFANYETSVDRGQPVELLLFRYGTLAGSYCAYTTATKPVVHDGITYQPVAVQRDEIKTDGKATDTQLKVEVERDSEIAELYRIYPPTQIVTLIIRQGHIPNDDDSAEFLAGENFLVCWSGRVLQDAPSGAKVTFTCELTSAGMKRPGLRLHYQRPCPAVLYGSLCQADKAAAQADTTVATVSSNRISFPDGWMPVDTDQEIANGTGRGITESDYIGGFIEWDGAYGKDYRTILDFSNGTFRLSAPVRNLDVGDAVRVILGCPHTIEGCQRLHRNVVNYAGQPFIPSVNPTGKNNHY